MKPESPSVYHYSLGDVIADTGRKPIAKYFHVFENDDIKIKNDRIFNRPLRSDQFTIALVLAGKAKIRINLIDFNLKKNSLFIVSNNIIHQFAIPTGDFKFINLGFAREFLGQTHFNLKHIDAFDFFSSQNIPYLDLEDRDAELLHMLMSVMREKDLSEEYQPFKEEIISHCFNIFMFEIATIFKRYRPNVNVVLSRKENILTSFLKLLAEHFKEERSVQYYADALFVTPQHLTKTLKELTNNTCGEMIDEMVIIEAKLMLDDLGLSVANVADQLNFSDQFFFSKFFKKHTGINPSKYKRGANP